MIEAGGFKNLFILPLFPQYAMSTTETALEAVKKEVRNKKMDIQLIIKDQFYDHPLFIKAFCAEINKYNPSTYDHLVFSYHGLPNRHLEICHPGIGPASCQCHQDIPDYGRYCYRATCYATSRLLAKELNLSPDNYTVAFQSRLSKNWMTPFTDDVLLAYLSKGCKRILVVAPSFVADCLETLIEIGEDYKKLFKEAGGEELQLVKSLNSDNSWIDALADIVIKTLNQKL